MSSYQSIDIKNDETSALKGTQSSSWKSLLLLGLVVFAGVILLSSYSPQKQNNEMKMDEFLINEDSNTRDLSFAPYGFESLADDMESLDLTDLSQVLSTLAKHGALDVTDLGTTSTARADAVRRTLASIIAKLNAEKAAVKSDYDKREQERLLVKTKANKAASDANNAQLAKKQTYDNLKKIADDGVATYNRESAADKKETDQLVADLTGVIGQIDRLIGYVPSVNCQVNDETDFTVAGWNVPRTFNGKKLHGVYDVRTRHIFKIFSGLKSTTNQVRVTFRLIYAHTPDNEAMYVNLNGKRVFTSNANGGAPQLSAAEKKAYGFGNYGVWYREVSGVGTLATNGVLRVDIVVLLDQAWGDEGWFFDRFKICDYGEPTVQYLE